MAFTTHATAKHTATMIFPSCGFIALVPPLFVQSNLRVE